MHIFDRIVIRSGNKGYEVAAQEEPEEEKDGRNNFVLRFPCLGFNICVSSLEISPGFFIG